MVSTRRKKIPLRNESPAHIANPGNARWCEEHGRLECTKHRKQKNGGGPCHQAAIKGTDGCRIHSGMRRQVQRVKGEAAITAWKSTGSPTIDYRMAVLSVLQMTWLRLNAYSELLRRQVAAEGAEILPGDDSDDPYAEIQPSGLIGHRYGAAGKDGVIYRQSEEVRALVALEAAERDRVVEYAKTAHDMGISDRLVKLAERWGDVVATRVTTLLDALDLTPEQAARVPDLITAHLGSIDVEAIGGGPAALPAGGRYELLGGPRRGGGELL